MSAVTGGTAAPDGGGRYGRGVDRITLIGLRDTPLSVDEVLAAVSDPAAGGIVVFVGAVRDRDRGKGVETLSYSAHPGAADALRVVCEKVLGRHDVTALAALHRTGDLAVGDIAVVVAVSAPHRAEAFEAARTLIDDLKEQVPIWKRQSFAGGEIEWVGLGD